MRSILSAIAVISAMGVGYYADDIGHGATVAVYQMGDELHSIYSFFAPDIEVAAKACIDESRDALKSGQLYSSDYCRDIIRQWRERDGDNVAMRYFMGIPDDFKPIDFTAPRP